MLLEFSTENYKSFKDKVTFSMIPAPKQKGLDYSILHKKIDKKEYKALSAAVVYGPNASGKTNIIGAIQTFKNIVLRGNIRNAQFPSTSNPADYALELIPNNTLTNQKNVSFAIKFIKNDMLIEYSVILDLGMFLEKDKDRSVIDENLTINEKMFFHRENNKIDFKNINFFEKYFISDFKKNFKTASSIAQNSLRKDELFLMNGFKTIVSSDIAEMVTKYLYNDLQTIYHADRIIIAPIFKSNTIIDKYLNQAVSAFGLNSNKLIYAKEKNDENPPILCSVMNDNKVIPAEVFESYGTIRFVNSFPLIAETLKTGATIIIDEFDASIHPMAIMSLISIFHNDEVNIHNAQLIFNTHNPLYLNNNLFRRDEIKFIDRDDNTQCSRHYSLSDFGTKGTNARKDKDYMNNYFVNEYGAIKDIDFTDIFKKIIEEK